jgi:cytochrome c-type biogenesis protein CcmH
MKRFDLFGNVRRLGHGAKAPCYTQNVGQPTLQGMKFFSVLNPARRFGVQNMDCQVDNPIIFLISPQMLQANPKFSALILSLARCFSAGIVCLLLLALFTPARAQTPAPTPIPDDAVNAIARGLYCPVCQNVTLEVCPTEACARWREQVRELIGQGKNESEIRDYFIQKFGMRTVGVPTNTLGQLLTIGMPFALVLIVGGALTLRAIQRRRLMLAPDVPEGVDDAPALDMDYAARLEQELKERK